MRKRTMQDVIRKNKEAGRFFFSKGTMRFFNSKIETPLLYDRFFITSERMNIEDKKKYTIREALPDGKITTNGDFCRLSSLSEAKKMLKSYIN